MVGFDRLLVTSPTGLAFCLGSGRHWRALPPLLRFSFYPSQSSPLELKPGTYFTISPYQYICWRWGLPTGLLYPPFFGGSSLGYGIVTAYVVHLVVLISVYAVVCA
jgi:hypothetical protein